MLKAVRQNFKPKTVLAQSGLRNGIDYTLNVIQFTRKSGADSRQSDPFKKMANLNRGEYRIISGLESIESYTTRSKQDSEK